MKHLLLIVVLACVLACALAISGSHGHAASAQASAPASPQAAAATQSTPPDRPKDLGNDQENARQARAMLDQAIQALGGQAYLNIHDMEQQGRTFSFHHGASTSNGILFWRFVEYPDKERLELTPQRDVALVYNGNKGYEVTYKGPHAVEDKDLVDYLRRRRLSLETILRTWVNDPTVALFYDGNALAGNYAAHKVTLINSKDEAVSIFFDVDTHLPIKKSYVWRDPVDHFRNVEEETFDNYRPVQGVMVPWGFTRYFNGDMQTERFVNGVHINQALDETMFDPNSAYNPNKGVKKH
jgi:hypothetical protein